MTDETVRNPSTDAVAVAPEWPEDTTTPRSAHE